MKFLSLYLFFLSCSKIEEAQCLSSENRIKSIKDQRRVLLELKNLGKLGKKKFKTIDNILADEQNLEARKFRKRCTS